MVLASQCLPQNFSMDLRDLNQFSALEWTALRGEHCILNVYGWGTGAYFPTDHFLFTELFFPSLVIEKHLSGKAVRLNPAIPHWLESCHWGLPQGGLPWWLQVFPGLSLAVPFLKQAGSQIFHPVSVTKESWDNLMGVLCAAVSVWVLNSQHHGRHHLMRGAGGPLIFLRGSVVFRSKIGSPDKEQKCPICHPYNAEKWSPDFWVILGQRVMMSVSMHLVIHLNWWFMQLDIDFNLAHVTSKVIQSLMKCTPYDILNMRSDNQWLKTSLGHIFLCQWKWAVSS